MMVDTQAAVAGPLTAAAPSLTLAPPPALPIIAAPTASSSSQDAANIALPLTHPAAAGAPPILAPLVTKNLTSSFSSSQSSTSRRPSAQAQDLAHLLANMTQDKFDLLTPAHQKLLREYSMQQQKILAAKTSQQALLGLGYPNGTLGHHHQQQQQQQPLSAINGPSTPNAAAQRQGSVSGSLGGPSRPMAGRSSSAQVADPSFTKVLTDFHEQRGTSFSAPTVESLKIDMARLYTSVAQNGGYAQVCEQNLWRSVATQLGFTPGEGNTHPDSRIQTVSQIYYAMLLPFESALHHMQQQARMHQRSHPALTPTPATPQQVHYQQQQQQHIQQQQQQQLQRPSSSSAAPSPSSFSNHASPQLPAETFAVPRSLSRGGSASYQQQQQQQFPSGGNIARSNAASPVTPSAGRSARAPTPSLQMQMQYQQQQQQQIQIQQQQQQQQSYQQQQQYPQQQMQQQQHGSVAGSPAVGYGGVPTTMGEDVKGKGRAPSDEAELRPSLPPPPPSKPKRKRIQYEYVPLSRNVDTYAGWNLDRVEEMTRTHDGPRDKLSRGMNDLGQIDVYSITMSLKSRLGTEVAFALNSLNLISMNMKQREDDHAGQIVMSLAECGDLVEELVELWEETALGTEEDRVAFPPSSSSKIHKLTAAPSSTTLLTYQKLYRMIAQEAGEMQTQAPSRWSSLADNDSIGRCPLGPQELVLAISMLIRNFSMTWLNDEWLATSGELLPTMMRIVSLPLRDVDESRGGSAGVRRIDDGRLQVVVGDAMILRKDALEVIANIGLHLKLDANDDPTSIAVFDLFIFFLSESHHSDQLYLDLCVSVGEVAHQVQPAHSSLSHYVDLALTAFSRISTIDTNRTIFARLADPEQVYNLFLSLITLLPVEESDFALVTHPAGLIFMENLSMSLYNLAFLAPASIKQRWRCEPRVINGIARIVKRLCGPKDARGRVSSTHHFTSLCDRCILLLQMLNDVGGLDLGGQSSSSASSAMSRGVGASTTAAAAVMSEGVWAGLGVYEEEDLHRSIRLVPTESDRGSVRFVRPHHQANIAIARSAGNGGAGGKGGVLSGGSYSLSDILNLGLTTLL